MIDTINTTNSQFKQFSLEDENFGQDSTTRLMTANHLIGLPRRDPIRNKVVPKMQGVLGGETAAQNLMALENTVLGFIQGRLPKISDPRFSKGGKRRAASIPPKTASATLGALISPNNATLQSLVNNNAFLGRGKFS